MANTHPRSFVHCRAVSTLKKGEKSVATNGVKNPPQDDDSWEVATGNDLELSSDSIIPCPYPHERSRATSGPRGGDHEADEALFLEQIKVVPRIRLRNSLSLPTDLRNDRKKDAVPRYTILKRNPRIYRDDNVTTTTTTTTMTMTMTTKVEDGCAEKSTSKSIESVKDDRYDTFISGSSGNCKQVEKCTSRKGRLVDKGAMVVSNNNCGGNKSGMIVQGRSSSAKCSKEACHQEAFHQAEDTLRKRVVAASDLCTRGKRQSRTKFCSSRNNLNKERACPDDERQRDGCSQRWPRRSNVDDRVERRFNKGRRLFIILVKVLGIIFLYYIVIKTD